MSPQAKYTDHYDPPSIGVSEHQYLTPPIGKKRKEQTPRVAWAYCRSWREWLPAIITQLYVLETSCRSALKRIVVANFARVQQGLRSAGWSWGHKEESCVHSAHASSQSTARRIVRLKRATLVRGIREIGGIVVGALSFNDDYWRTLAVPRSKS